MLETQINPTALFRQTAAQVRADMTARPELQSPEVTQRLLQELRVRQIELELQNDELRHAQAELNASRTRYFDLYDLAPVPYFTLNAAGLILEANLAASQLLGVTRSALVKQPFTAVILPADQDIWFRLRKQLLSTGLPQSCELRLLVEGADPSWVLIKTSVALDLDGVPLYRAVASDITEHKRFEEVQSFLLQRAHQHSGQAFFGALAQYLSESLNMCYACIGRLQGDALTAQTVAICSDGKVADNVTYVLKDTPCSDIAGQTICCFPENVRRLFPKDTMLQTLQAESYLGATLWSFDGKPLGLIALIDRKPLIKPRLTEAVLKLVAIHAAVELERQQADERLRRLTEELQRSNRDLEQFASAASHDLQEPLRMVSSFMGLLQEHCRGRLDPVAETYIGFAVDNATRMQALIKDLLAYARIGREKTPVQAEVSRALDNALDNLRMSLVETGARIIREPLPAIPISLIELTQLFQNLIGNALKFHRPGVAPEIHIGAKQANDPFWLFTVRDNGIGIAPEFATCIFEIFQRLHTREEYEGTGIGLALCQKIVERHGGRIWVESEKGQGATFCFTLPTAGIGDVKPAG